MQLLGQQGPEAEAVLHHMQVETSPEMAWCAGPSKLRVRETAGTSRTARGFSSKVSFRLPSGPKSAPTDYILPDDARCPFLRPRLKFFFRAAFHRSPWPSPSTAVRRSLPRREVFWVFEFAQLPWLPSLLEQAVGCVQGRGVRGGHRYWPKDIRLHRDSLVVHDAGLSTERIRCSPVSGAGAADAPVRPQSGSAKGSSLLEGVANHRKAIRLQPEAPRDITRLNRSTGAAEHQGHCSNALHHPQALPHRPQPAQQDPSVWCSPLWGRRHLQGISTSCGGSHLV